jgi:hypothetical protein
MVYEPYIDYFKEGQNVGGGSVRSSVSPHAKVAATEMTLDSLGLTDVSFMKIDIEGYEYYALLGAVDTITACRPVILYEHFWDPEAHRATKNLGWQPKERFEEFFAEHDYHLVREPQGPEVFALPSELV